MRTLAIVAVIGLLLAACRSSSRPEPYVLPDGPAEATEATKPTRRVYVGQVSTQRYHVEACRLLDGVDETDQVLFENPGEAQDRDWHPCAQCRPQFDW